MPAVSSKEVKSLKTNVLRGAKHLFPRLLFHLLHLSLFHRKNHPPTDFDVGNFTQFGRELKSLETVQKAQHKPELRPQEVQNIPGQPDVHGGKVTDSMLPAGHWVAVRLSEQPTGRGTPREPFI